MKASVSLLLLVGLGIAACNPPTAPKTSTTPPCDPNGGGESIFGYVPPCDNPPQPPPPPPPPPSHVTLTRVAVAPKQVRAGDQFTVSGAAVFALSVPGPGPGPGTPAGAFFVTYAGLTTGAIPSDSTFTLALTAVVGDTVVTVEARCAEAVATQTVTIQVLPAQ